MASNLLTERKILTIKPAEKELLITDGGGLYLRVLPSGTKSWQVKFTHKGEQIKSSLGIYPDISLQQARETTAAIRKDPSILSPKEDDSPATVDALMKLWLKEYLPKHRNEEGVDKTERRYNLHVKPALGDSPLDEVTRRDVMALVRKVTEGGAPTQANEILSDLRRIYLYAAKNEWVLYDPTLGIEKGDAGGHTEPGERVLSEVELGILKQKIAGPQNSPDFIKDHPLPMQSTFAIFIALATLGRINEVVRAKAEHLDFENGTWTIPKPNSKNKKEFVVHLNEISKPLFRLLAERAGEDGILFRGRARKDGKMGQMGRASLSSQIWLRQADKAAPPNKPSKVLVLPGGPWSFHALRRTGATMMGELGVDGDVIDLCLNHSLTRLKKTYQKQIRMKHRKKAFKKLGAKLAELLEWEDTLPRISSRLDAKQRGVRIAAPAAEIRPSPSSRKFSVGKGPHNEEVLPQK